MSLKQLLLLLIGFTAGLFAAKSYPMTTALLDDGEVWQAEYHLGHDRDTNEIKINWLANDVQQQVRTNPHARLVLSCQLKQGSVRTEDAAASGMGVIRGD